MFGQEINTIFKFNEANQHVICVGSEVGDKMALYMFQEPDLIFSF